MVFFSLIVVLALGAAQAESAPLAQSPPLGWRSWNCFKLLVDQPKILEQVDALVESGLLAAGYKEIGIDDGWQACGAGINGSAHDADGLPLVNNTRFPDMLAMTKAAHKKNVSMGFYMNNCFCHKQELATNHTTYTQDVDLVVKAEFDGLKIDGCGPNHDIGKWMDAIQKSGRPITVENCGDNNNGPPGDKQRWSPPLPSDLEGDKCLRKGQFYRVSKDIAPQFYSAMYNLQYTSKYNNKGLTSPLSRPGCWAYPVSYGLNV
jgi:alpha-galactosidase